MYNLDIKVERPNAEPFTLNTKVMNLNLLVLTLKAVIEELDPGESKRALEIKEAIRFKANHSCPTTYSEG